MLSLVTAFLPVIDKLVELIPDKNAREKEKAALTQQLISIVATESQNQAEINKAEATHSSIFVAGWRPMIGWVCAVGFGWTYVGVPVIAWASSLFGVVPYLPKIDNGLFELTMGMLGMGALRSFDKWKGTAK